VGIRVRAIPGGDCRPTESDELLISLTCSRQEWLLITLLERSLNNSEGIRLQDAVTAWNNMPRAAISSRVAFSYIRKSWSSLFERFGKDEFLIGNILQGAISGLATEVDLKDVEEFYNANGGRFIFAERKIEQETEGLRLRVEWH
jgi:hypothetical protein